jgi:DNA-binding NarL/FixJ family response regulator
VGKDEAPQQGDRPTKVAVIEDQRTLREGFAVLIEATEGFRCTGAYRTIEEALRGFAGNVPDVALVDIGLPGVDGIEGVRIFKERFPHLTMLILTVYDEDERVFDALCAGACGYLLKKTRPARLLESIKEAAGGGSPMSPEIARKVVTLFREVRPPRQAEHDLTPHELRLLKLLVDGHSYKTAAAELRVSYNTICFHIKNVYGKLQVHSKSEAVSKALRNRLTP